MRIFFSISIFMFLWMGLLLENKGFDHTKKVLAEINRQRKIQKVINKIPARYRSKVVRACKKNKIPITIVYNLVYHESRWKNYATGYNRNGTVDRGLFQLNSRYLYTFSRAYFRGRRINPYNPNHSISVGIRMLAWYKKYFKGNWRKVLYSYNWGMGNVIANRPIPTVVRRYADKILRTDI